MRQRITAASMLAWLLTIAALPAAHAQRAQPAASKDEIAALQTMIDELRQATVQIPTLAAAVTELGEQLAVIRQMLDTIHAEHKAVPGVTERLDTVSQTLDTLTRDVENLRTRVASQEQTPVRDGSGLAYKGGFEWTTADGRYMLTLGGYTQARYELNVAGGDIDTATLRVRRARVSLSGRLGEKLGYKVLLSAIREKPALDYYLDYQLSDHITARAGQYKTQFTRNFITSSTQQVFLESPAAISSLFYDWDVQAGFHGTLGRIGYYAGIGNGAGPNKLNDNKDVNMTVRVDATLTGKRFGYGYGDLERTAEPALMIGAGLVHDLVPMSAEISGLTVNTDVDTNGEVDNARIISASADAVVRWRGLEAAVEAVVRHEDLGKILEHPDNAELLAAAGERRTHWGVSAQVTYFLPKHVLVGTRLGWGQLSFLGTGGRSHSLPGASSLWEMDGLVALTGLAGIPPVSLVGSTHTYSPDTAREHRLILETMLKF